MNAFVAVERLREVCQRILRKRKMSMSAHFETCDWKQNEVTGYWEGDCGLAWEFTTGTPETNGFWCCPRCGRFVHVTFKSPEIPKPPSSNPHSV